MPTQPIDASVASKVKEIKAFPYANSIVSEDVIERNFGYKIIRHQISAGKNTIIYKCEKYNHPETYCLVKTYQLGKDRVKQALKEETCQIMRYVTGKCPLVISTYDIFYTNEKLYLMCDWSSKGVVPQNLRRKSVKLNEELLRVWASDLLNAINFLHSNAICHRNISPSCLLLTPDDHVKIGTLSDAVIYCQPDGTLNKMKWSKFSPSSNWNQGPEIAKCKVHDPRRADVWCFGATIFWLATGLHPINFRSATKMTKQLERNLGMIRKVSSKGQNFIKYVLTYQPSSRPTIMQAMQHEWITQAASTEPTQKGPEPEELVAPERPHDTAETTGPEELPEGEASASNKNARSTRQTETQGESPPPS